MASGNSTSEAEAVMFWQGKHVIVTGASSGIGRALAEHLSGRGAKLGLLARRRELLAELARSICAGGAEAAFAAADVVDLPGVLAAVRALEDQLGPCDVLIANAGIYRKTDVRKFDPAEANRVIATNVQGVINSFAAVLPGMTERRRGHLAAVGSIAGMLGLPAAGAYSASKAAVVTLLESLRVDLYPLGVKVTAVCPGFVDTPMLTDQERATRKDLLGAAETARRISRAIERGRAEYWFPWRTRLLAATARLLPPGLYCRIMARVPAMEEAPPGP